MRMKIIYFMKEAVVSFRRNWFMSVAATSTVGLSLLVLGAVLVGATVMNNAIRAMERKFEVVVFLQETASPGAIDDLQKQVFSWPETKNVRYVSKQEALERLREDLKNQPDILQQLEDNPLPPSLEVKLKDPRKVKIVSQRLRNKPGVDEIKDQRVLVERAVSFFDLMRNLGTIFTILLSFAAMTLIGTTIRLAIYARRHEIGIMKLVGASNWFIRWPFLLEGVFEGLLGGLLAIAFLYAGWVTMMKIATETLRFLPISFSAPLFWNLSLYLVAAGIGIGGIASIVALWRFLRV